MTLAPGTRLGPYEIVSPLDSGGMGDVYTARDTRLDRLVAIKTSRAEFSERFEREARAVAALNHPNICQLYDVGPSYIVMERVKGTPIQPTSDVGRLLNLAIQIADGLAAAHAAGIVHRDPKPSNVLVTQEGQVKILDFGLAMMAPLAIGASDVTRPQVRTETGVTLGTAAYSHPSRPAVKTSTPERISGRSASCSMSSRQGHGRSTVPRLQSSLSSCSPKIPRRSVIAMRSCLLNSTA